MDGLAQGKEEGLAKGKEEGLAEGKLAEKQAIAKNLLATGLDVETISKATGLTSTEIQKLF